MKKYIEKFLSLSLAKQAARLLLAGGAAIGTVWVARYLIETMDTWLPPVLGLALIAGVVCVSIANKPQKPPFSPETVQRVARFLFGLFQNARVREAFSVPVMLLGVQNSYDLRQRGNIGWDGDFPFLYWELQYRPAPEYANGPRPQGIELGEYLYSAFQSYADRFMRSEFPLISPGTFIPSIYPVDISIINDHLLQIKILYVDSPEIKSYADSLNREQNWNNTNDEPPDDIIF